MNPGRTVIFAALVVVAAIAWFMAPKQQQAPAGGTIQGATDRTIAAAKVVSRTAVTGNCKPGATAALYPVTGEIVLYADGTRAISAKPAKAADGTPEAISLDAAWWEANGRAAGKLSLPGLGQFGGTAPRTATLLCDMDLPAAP